MAYTKPYIVSLHWKDDNYTAYITGGNSRVAVKKFIMHVMPTWSHECDNNQLTKTKNFPNWCEYHLDVHDATFIVHKIHPGADFVMIHNYD